MSEKDAGFCSGEDDLDVDDVHSPTDGSEDSIEVRVTAISPRSKNKRKCAEPRKVPLGETGPLKKRIRRDLSQFPDTDPTVTQQSCFRPWNGENTANDNILQYHPVYGYQPPSPTTPPSIQEEPLSLVKTDRESRNTSITPSVTERITSRQPDPGITSPIPVIRPKEFARCPTQTTPHPALRPTQTTTSSIEHISSKFNVDTLLQTTTSTSPTTPRQISSSACSTSQKEHRNYKNMTRERRIEANARERTRVHTISAAFETLRRAIPAYSHNQKLSKLSVLRIACSYILTLARVAGHDYSADQSEPTVASCVDLVSRTIQTEGKLRKKRED